VCQLPNRFGRPRHLHPCRFRPTVSAIFLPKTGR
jgi:hypothetical protein